MNPREIFDTNYDYRKAVERNTNRQQSDGLRLVGRFARLVASDSGAIRAQEKFDQLAGWWKSFRQERRDDKTDRAYNGSLDEISDSIVPFHEAYELKPNPNEPSKTPRPVVAAPGVYRSNYSGEQPQPGPNANEMDTIMHGAVQRAKQNLGTLPVITMQQNPDTSPGTDDALLERLERDFAAPAAPEHRYKGRHRANDQPDNDDTLVGTDGK